MRINPQRQYPIQIIKCNTSRRKQKQKPTPVLARNQPANQIKKDKGHLQSEKVKLHHQFKSFFASLPQKKTAIFNTSIRVLPSSYKSPQNIGVPYFFSCYGEHSTKKKIL